MRRVSISKHGVDLDNHFYHLARYMFAARQIDKTDKVLDFGCGTGYGARLLSDFAESVYAFDKDTKLVEEQNKFKKDNLIFCKTLPECSNKFDKVVSFEVVEHIELANVNHYFNNIKKRMKNNGVLFISTPRAVPFENRSLNRQREHVYEYSPQEFRELLKSHFTNVFLFSQNDSSIGYHNPEMAWNLVAICTGLINE